MNSTSPFVALLTYETVTALVQLAKESSRIEMELATDGVAENGANSAISSNIPGMPTVSSALKYFCRSFILCIAA